METYARNGARVWGIVVAGILSGCGVTDLETPIDSPADIMAGLVNEHRIAVGCAPLSWITEMSGIAQAHSVDMVERDFFDHVNPDGKSPMDRMTEAGLSHSHAAENIAMGGSAELVLAGWLESGANREVVEDCSLTEHGIGFYQGRWTHLFRTP